MTTYPANFIAENYSHSKRPNIAFEIIGLDEKYTFAKTFVTVTYGSGLSYGSGFLYGGSNLSGDFKPYLSEESNFTIAQRIEPEQGKGNTGDITVVLVDKDETGSRLVSPGIVLDEILGKECRLWLGYQGQTYPEDYFVLFQGYITNVITQSGKIRLTISDATQKKRQGTFFAFKGYQWLPQIAGQLNISLSSTANLPEGVLNLNGVYDPLVALYLKVANEFMLLSPTWDTIYDSNYRRVQLLARGQRGTTDVSHNPITVTGNSPATNRYLDCICDGVTFSAAVPNGDYYIADPSTVDAQNFCYKLQSAMQSAYTAAGGSTSTFSVAVNVGSTYYFDGGQPNRYKFVITAAGGSGFQLRFLSGANHGNNLQEILGFADLNYSGGQSYISPNWVDSGSSDVTAAVAISGHPLDVALSIMLSGFDGPFITDQLALGVGYDGTTANGYAICLPPGTDAVRDYGLTSGLGIGPEVTKLGDQVTISGSVTPANNQNCIITAILAGPDNDNQLLYVLPTSGTLTQDTSSSVRLAFRSKYDRLPTGYGLKIPPKFVDVAAHEYVRDVYLNDSGYQIFPLIQNQQVGKDFIESQCYLPFGCYGVTKLGRLSLSLTRPPIAQGDPVQLDKTNILNPENITVTRGLNNRRFFNLIQYQYDKTDAGKYLSVYRALDTDSLNTIGQTTILPINSDGLQTTVNGTNTGSPTVITSIANRFLNRYADVAFEIKLQVNLEAGARIEAGDIVKVVDDGTLGITNFDTGDRNLGDNLFEVIDRTMDVKSGVVSLTLLSNVGFLSSDRFGGIAPSSFINDFLSQPTTSSDFALWPGFGYVFGSNEYLKWVDYVGQEVVVSAVDWSYSGTSTIVSYSPADSLNPYGRVQVDPPLSFIPNAGDILNLAPYSTSALPTINAYSKSVHAYLDPSVSITAGTSATVFTVGLGDVSKFLVGAILYVHDDDYTNRSPNVEVLSADAGTGVITVSSSLGFTPAAGMLAELIGFADHGAGYMFS